MGDGNGAAVDEFVRELDALGFSLQGSSRRGGRMWSLDFNRYLTFTLHDFGHEVLLTWSFALGDFAEDRGWMLGSGETSFHQLFPRHDVKLARDVDEVGAEITRTLSHLRVDLGDPSL